MQPYMKNSSNQNSIDQSEYDFHYDATVPGYIILTNATRIGRPMPVIRRHINIARSSYICRI